MTSLHLSLGERSYDITIGKDLLKSADKYFNLNRKVLVLTDSGVPKEYSERIAALCKDALIYTVQEGEGSKSLTTLEKLLSAMMDYKMTRKDALVAVGGGVVGDLGGFAASVYMRGIDFYNAPTTILSQVDSSIGGKTAVNLGSTKNIVGSFYQPKAVLIDTDTQKTLPKRQISAGLAEAVKMALTSSEELFEIFESEENGEDNIEKIIVEALKIKKSVVEKDEKESGLRKILNFGHTLGHGIEADSSLGSLYHGECVALGMLPVCSPEVRARLVPVLKKLDLPTEYDGNIDSALEYASHDKKADGDGIDVVLVEKVGEFKLSRMTLNEFGTLVKKNF